MVDIVGLGGFAFLNILSFGTMFYGMKPSLPLAPILSVLGMVLFFGLGLMMIGDIEVATETTTPSYQYQTINPATGNLVTLTQPEVTVKETFIEDGVTDVLIYVYVGLATFSLILFITRWTRPGQ